MLNVLIKLLTAVINLLPASPIIFYVEQMEGIDELGMLNWFIPFGTFVSILGKWCICMGLYYVYRMTRSKLKD